MRAAHLSLGFVCAAVCSFLLANYLSTVLVLAWSMPSLDGMLILRIVRLNLSPWAEWHGFYAVLPIIVPAAYLVFRLKGFCVNPYVLCLALYASTFAYSLLLDGFALHTLSLKGV